jgi:hypothetical protein
LARQNLNRGSAANDGTGDTLRQAGLKINQNFSELYSILGSRVDSANNLSTVMSFDSSALAFDSATYTVQLKATTPTANRTIYLPNASDTLVGKATTDTLTNKTLTSAVLTTPQINDTSADHQYVFGVNELAADRTITLPLLTGNDTFTFNAHTQTLTNKTLSAPVLNVPRVGTAITDSAGNEFIKLTKVNNAVNELTLSNALNGGPTLEATGDSANINININAKGTGSVELEKAAFDHQEITSDGAASTAVSYIIGNKGSALAVSLADGTTIGEYKLWTNKGAGAMTVTPSNFAQGTSFALAQYDGCTTIWDGTNWYLVGNQSSVTVA